MIVAGLEWQTGLQKVLRSIFYSAVSHFPDKRKKFSLGECVFVGEWVDRYSNEKKRRKIQTHV